MPIVPTVPECLSPSGPRRPSRAVGQGNGPARPGSLALVAFLLSYLAVSGPAVAQGRQTAQAPHGAYCTSLSTNISRLASNGFRVLNARQFCAAVQLLESAYQSFDFARMNCGGRWAQAQAILEMDLLDALDYAGEACGPR